MLDNRILKAANKQSGFSLIELMIAIVLGLLVTAAVTAMTVNSLKMSGDTLKSARLNQDLGAVMQIMVNDIRRAGYGGDAGLFPADEDVNIVSSSCILYSYNRDDNSSIDDSEMNGFKLDGGDIKMRTSCDLDTYPNCPTDCSLGTWVELTDPGVITITEFEIDSENSKCHNINKSVSIRIAPDATATEFACNETTHGNVQEGAIGDGDWSWGAVSDAANKLSSKGLKEYGKNDDPPVLSVGVRHVNISLKGVFNDPFVETGSDYDEYPIKKSLDVSIKVRNDHVYKISP